MNGRGGSAPDGIHFQNREVACSTWPREQDFRWYSFGVFSGEPYNFSFPILLTQIVIIASTSRVLNFLFRPFKQLRIIGDIFVLSSLFYYEIPIQPHLLLSELMNSNSPNPTCNNFQAGFLLGPEFLGRLLPGYSALLFSDREMMISHTLSAAGIMLYCFLVSVKMDPAIVAQSGRRTVIIGLCNSILPMILMILTAIPLRSHIPSAIAQSNFIIFLVAPLSITNFPVIADALTELQLLNTELGRLALSASLINTSVGWLLFIFMSQDRGGLDKAFKMVFSMLILVLLIVFPFRRWMLWIVRRTPKGQRVGEFQVFAVLMCMLGVAVLSEMIGATNINGVVALGLVIPEGTPLGAALVETIELVSNEIMLPLFYANAGRYVSLAALVHWRSWMVLMCLLGLVYVAKFVWTFVPAVYFCKVPARQAFILGLIFNIRGLVNLITYYKYRVQSLLEDESFSIVIFSYLLVTVIVTPTVQKLYQPLPERRHSNRRTIQHLKPNSQLRLLACVQNDDPIPCIINLLESSSPASPPAPAPLLACVLHLDEQPGRADSILIAHSNSKGFLNPKNMDRLHNAFTHYEKSKDGLIEVRPYTSISPSHNMCQEICALAAQENVALVIVPVTRRSKIYGGSGHVEDYALRSAIPKILAQVYMEPKAEKLLPHGHVEDYALRSAIPKILAQAPCSVGLLVHQGLQEPLFNSPSKFQQHIGVLFWSGPDSREALAYASQMARHSGVNLTVTRFFAASEEVQNKTQALLDDEVMAVFQLENAGNERVTVQEIVVEDMEHAICVIREVGCGGYDFVVVGLRFGWRSPVLERLEEWCENPELGVIGDVMASLEFDRCFSVLVVQQKT
ncbi:cation/H(+) antiporter 15-like [Phalaenopsis equestris]|uniref:cation/H(+) antiporter 15-like n=1 Tax=Phalaenopsis equestris TaxID=78828 RepID=UPI0009E1A01F|nr:cation/H(+) antiporter 15-like [Phalaenopsis equestris]